MVKGIELDHETADRIAVAVMVNQLKYLKEEVRLHLEQGEYMHPEDLMLAQGKYIPALETLIAYFGGVVK